MMVNDHDPLLEDLRNLRTPAPPDLVTQLLGNWIRMSGPLGDLYVAFTDRGVSYVRTAESMGDDETFLESFRRRFGRPLRRASRPPAGLVSAWHRRGAARHVPVDLRQSTEFERDVLTAARNIPFGQTRPYSWIAKEVGQPGAIHAVRAALAANPVPMLIPCHRVVHADGRLGGYVFGADVQEQLLRAENANIDELRQLASANIYYLGSDTTHIVCYPACAHARRISRPHRRGFRDTAAATRAGYRPCKHCRPGPR